jgi:hypothetical protein
MALQLGYDFLGRFKIGAYVTPRFILNLLQVFHCKETGPQQYLAGLGREYLRL